MLAPAQLPHGYADWNARHHAPIGPAWWRRLLVSRYYKHLWPRRFRFPGSVLRKMGPFALQENSLTRAFEYPWVYEQIGPRPGLRCLEIGSGAGGLQFVLADAGAKVVSVDPLLNPEAEIDWTFTKGDFDRMNRAFGGKVEFHQAFLEKADVPEGSFDTASAVSVLEHIPREGLAALCPAIRRALKAGGRLIATIDLFLDCAPFTAKPSNAWGRNIDVRELVEMTGMKRVLGEPSELCGFAEFDPDRIRAMAPNKLVVENVMTQCLILER